MPNNNNNAHPILLQCPYCDRSFLRQSETDRHIKTHTKEKPFKCLQDDCNKYFSRRDNMMQHYRCHTSGGYISRREDKINKYKEIRSQTYAALSLKTLSQLSQSNFFSSSPSSPPPLSLETSSVTPNVSCTNPAIVSCESNFISTPKESSSSTTTSSPSPNCFSVTASQEISQTTHTSYIPLTFIKDSMVTQTSYPSQDKIVLPSISSLFNVQLAQRVHY